MRRSTGGGWHATARTEDPHGRRDPRTQLVYRRSEQQRETLELQRHVRELAHRLKARFLMGKPSAL
jgi:hypothetical protein